MKIGIIAGNRSFPVLLAENIKKESPTAEIVGFCFKGETSPAILKFLDKVYWLKVGRLGDLKRAVLSAQVSQLIMAGQINPLRVFQRRGWDEELKTIVNKIPDFRAHTIFKAIIDYLETYGVEFIDSTKYLKGSLATEGEMTTARIKTDNSLDIAFGVEVVSRYVDLDVGQTIAVKSKSVVSLESLEGTDKTIRRGANLSGRGITVLKFSKRNQDFRFDVPVVGLKTLSLLKRVKAAALVLEAGRVLILDKEKFLSKAADWGINVFGARKTPCC
ncbi:MAG: UDP-2,3-diacylglucosamine diphosphatase LpxI [Candidatus Omnitrophica bacterium]|nr:UDP-2,3-diacylglucosamine diphosphatase LpxI [Candidatus Omnitrophota bacterium]